MKQIQTQLDQDTYTWLLSYAQEMHSKGMNVGFPDMLRVGKILQYIRENEIDAEAYRELQEALKAAHNEIATLRGLIGIRSTTWSENGH